MMASPNLGITHITAGQNNKEATANAAVDALDNSTNAIATVTFASDADDTMTAAEWTGSKVIRIAGSITAARVMTVPATARHVEVWNDTSETVTIRSASPSSPVVDVEVAAGARVGIASDGADIYESAAGSSGATSNLTPSSLTLTGTNPFILFEETDGTSGYEQTVVRHAGDTFRIELYSADALVDEAFIIRYDSSGATDHEFFIGATLAAQITIAGTSAPSATEVITREKGDARYGLLAPSVNAQTGTTYTLVLADQGKVVTMSNASANTLTIPTNASVAFPTGTVINVVMLGAGQTTVTGDTGVTVNGVSAGSGDLSAQYAAVALLKIGTDTWVASGGIGAVA